MRLELRYGVTNFELRSIMHTMLIYKSIIDHKGS